MVVVVLETEPRTRPEKYFFLSCAPISTHRADIEDPWVESFPTPISLMIWTSCPRLYFLPEAELRKAS